MICGNTNDFIGHPILKDSIFAHGASHHAWAPGPPPSKSGAEPTTPLHTNPKQILIRGGRHWDYIFVGF